MKRAVSYLLFVLLCLGVGYLSSFLQACSLEAWYPMLVKSPFTPSPAVFPVVWFVLYLLMGVVAAMVWNNPSIYSRLLFTLFLSQLLLNVVWSYCFFYMQSPLMGLVVILVLLMLALMYVAACFVVSRLCGWLMMPYLLWLFFATYLNAYIAVSN